MATILASIPPASAEDDVCLWHLSPVAPCDMELLDGGEWSLLAGGPPGRPLHGKTRAVWASKGIKAALEHVLNAQRHHPAIRAGGFKLYGYRIAPGSPQHALFELFTVHNPAGGGRMLPGGYEMYCTARQGTLRGPDVPFTMGLHTMEVKEVNVRAFFT